jgi:hypothetical protein
MLYTYSEIFVFYICKVLDDHFYKFVHKTKNFIHLIVGNVAFWSLPRRMTSTFSIDADSPLRVTRFLRNNTYLRI